jgi:hypothetical protein
MTPSVQTFHQSIGKQLVAKDPGASQVCGAIIAFKEIRPFPIVLSFFPKLTFYHLPLFSNEIMRVSFFSNNMHPHFKARASEWPKNTKN